MMRRGFWFNGAKAWEKVLVVLGLGVGMLLGRGLELCFGIGQYRGTAIFGALAGAGIGLMAWVGRIARDRDRAAPRRLVAAAAVPALAVFLVYFFWRVLPLIQEEIKYSL